MQNVQVRSRVRTQIRHFREAVSSGDDAKKLELYRIAQSAIDGAVNQGVLKAGTAARYKSRLSALL